MKKIITIASALFVLATGYSQVKQKIEIDNFTKVEAGGIFKVFLSQGDYNVELETLEENQGKVSIKKSGETLKMEVSESIIKGELKVYISAPNFEDFNFHGASKVKNTGTLNFETLSIKASGAVSIHLSDLNLQNLKTDLSGASDVSLFGSTITHNAELSGAAKLKANNFNSQNTSINISGAAHAEIFASASLVGSASGASNLQYSGHPQQVEVKQSGVAKIENNSNSVTMSLSNNEGLRFNSPTDTTKIITKRKQILIIDNGGRNSKEDSTIKKKDDEIRKYTTAGLFYGINGYVNNNYNFQLPTGYEFLELDVSNSSSIQLTFFDAKIELIKGKDKSKDKGALLTLHPGVSLDMRNYKMRKNYWIGQSSNTTGITGAVALNPDSSVIEFRKNDLNVSYLNLPLMLVFHTSQNHEKAFHFGIGAFGGMRGTATMAYKYKYDGKRYRNRVKDDFYLNPFQYGLMASIGYGNFNLFANYTLSNLFEKGKGPELHPFSIGMQILAF